MMMLKTNFVLLKYLLSRKCLKEYIRSRWSVEVDLLGWSSVAWLNWEQGTRLDNLRLAYRWFGSGLNEYRYHRQQEIDISLSLSVFGVQRVKLVILQRSLIHNEI